jgi:hypothetical protein
MSEAIKDRLVFRLRGPHVNPIRTAEFDEIRRLQQLCLEAADALEAAYEEAKELRIRCEDKA